jgi:hypothetical protein
MRPKARSSRKKWPISFALMWRRAATTSGNERFDHVGHGEGTHPLQHADRANTAGADAVNDIATDPLLGDGTNPATSDYYADALHLSLKG